VHADFATAARWIPAPLPEFSALKPHRRPMFDISPLRTEARATFGQERKQTARREWYG
jgi:hypothetical protein